METSQRKGDTRARLLDAAEGSILAKGFAATSIEELIAAVGITKSGFFYHFRDKGLLAKALLQRYIDQSEVLFDDWFQRADELSEDPLHAFLIWLKLLAEAAERMPGGHPGCFVAAICYQERLFDHDVISLNNQALLTWRARFRERLETIAERYPPRVRIDFDDLADMLTVIVNGGIVLAKAVKDKGALARQVLLYRDFVRAVFLGA
jgi:AcrR family transcriptional regulator